MKRALICTGILLSLALSFLPSAVAVDYVQGFAAVLNPDDSNSDPGGLKHAWVNHGFYAQSQHWVFYVKAGTCEGSTSRCLFYLCSADQGLTWASTALSKRTTNELFTVTNNGTHVFYARYNSTSLATFNQKFVFRVGSLGLGCAITWQNEQVVRAAGGAGTSTERPSIAVTDNDQVFIAYVNSTGSQATKKPFVIRSSGTDYSTWTEDTALETTNREWQVDIVKLASNKVLVAYWTEQATKPLLTRVYDGSWGAEVDSNQSENIDSEAFLFSDGDTAYAFYHNDDPERFEMVTRSPTGTWSARENVGTVDATSVMLWTVTYERLQQKFHLFYYNYTNNNISEVIGSPGSWPSVKLPRFTTIGATSSHMIASYEESVLVGGESFYGLFWTDNPDGGDAEIRATIARVSPVPETGNQEETGGGGFAFLPEIISKPIAEILYGATLFVLQWPVTFAIIGLTLSAAIISHVKKKPGLRDISLIGFGIGIGNWLIRNQPTLFGRYDISFLGPYSIGEPPLTFTLFGFSSSALAFSLVISFIAGMGFLMAVGLALRD